MHFLRSAYRDQIESQGFWVNYIIKMDSKKLSLQKSFLALIATKLLTSSFINIVDDKKILSFKDILQINYHKHYFEIKKSKIEMPRLQFSKLPIFMWRAIPLNFI